MNELIEYIKNDISITNTIQEKLNRISVKKEVQKGENVLSENSLNKWRLILSTYLLIGASKFIIRKEVQFEGTNDWIKRNEYNFEKIDK